MHEKARSDPRLIPAMLTPYAGKLSFKMEEPPYFLYFEKGKDRLDISQPVVRLVRRILTDIRGLITDQSGR